MSCTNKFPFLIFLCVCVPFHSQMTSVQLKRTREIRDETKAQFDAIDQQLTKKRQIYEQRVAVFKSQCARELKIESCTAKRDHLLHELEKHNEEWTHTNKMVNNIVFTSLDGFITEELRGIVLSYLVFCTHHDRFCFSEIGCLECNIVSAEEEYKVTYTCEGHAYVIDNLLSFSHPNDEEFWQNVVSLPCGAPVRAFNCVEDFEGEGLCVEVSWSIKSTNEDKTIYYLNTPTFRLLTNDSQSEEESTEGSENDKTEESEEEKP